MQMSSLIQPSPMPPAYRGVVARPVLHGLARPMFGQDTTGHAVSTESPVIPMEEMETRWNKVLGGLKGLLKNTWGFVWEQADYKVAFKRIQQSLWTIAQNSLFFGALITASFMPIPSFRKYIEQQFLYSPIKCTIRQDLKSDELKDHRILLDVDFRTSGDNTRLHGWYLPAQPGKPTAVYAHGRDHNIGNLEHVIETFKSRGWGIFVFDYRGFGDSAGKPSEEGLYDDFESACYYLKEKGIDYSDQVAVGHSMGTAVVTEVAANRIPNFKSVILLSPFTSIHDAMAQAKKRYSSFANWLFNHNIVEAKMDSIEKISKINVPVLSACGEKDNVTPPAMAQSLVETATCTKKKFVSLPGADHHTATLFSPESGNTLMDQLEDFVAQQPQSSQHPEAA